MTEVYEAAVGVKQLDEPTDLEGIQWLAIHDPTVSALHNGWCKASHGTIQPMQAKWGHFRQGLAQMVYTAWTIYRNEYSISTFWEEWGNNQVLARKVGPSHKGHLGSLEPIPGSPVSWDPG